MIVAAALLSVSGAASAQVAEEKFPCYVEVTGYAEREVAPDTFYLTIVLDESASKNKMSVDKQQRELIKTLQSLGVDTDSQLTMVDLSGEYTFKKKNTVTTARYRLKLSSVSDVQGVCLTLSEKGISNISIYSITNSHINEIRNEIRAEAVVNARSKATLLAEAVGQRVGDCIRIQDYSRDSSVEEITFAVRQSKVMLDTAESIAEDEDALEFKPIKVTANVGARFVLRNADGLSIEW